VGDHPKPSSYYIHGRAPTLDEACVYVLHDKDKVPVYVGSTLHPLKKRLGAHWRHGTCAGTGCPYPHIQGVRYVPVAERWEAEAGLYDYLKTRGFTLANKARPVPMPWLADTRGQPKRRKGMARQGRKVTIRLPGWALTAIEARSGHDTVETWVARLVYRELHEE
jgi:hypothetical protein